MKINFYYAPFPSQKFSGSDMAISTERCFNPKSALTTLISGFRKYYNGNINNFELEIIDMQLIKKYTFYKSLMYGEKELCCYRLGGEFEEYIDSIKEATIHAITCNFTNSAQVVTDLASFIKKVNSNAFVIVGGTAASGRPQYFLQRDIDIVIEGEGEVIFSKVIEAYINNKDIQNIAGVFSRNNLKSTRRNAPLIDINELEPMALDLIPNIDIYTDTGEGTPPKQIKSPYICFETSRGCWQNCSFCTTPQRGRYRFMKPSTVKKHFNYFLKNGIKTLLFQEDNILSRIHRDNSGNYLYPNGRDEVIEIFEMAKNYGFSWEFANGLEFGKLYHQGAYDLELMDALFWNQKSESEWLGCYRVQIPLEDLKNDTSSKFAKLISFDKQMEILKMIMSYGVNHQTYNVIIGFPDDDDDALAEYKRKCNYLKNELSAIDSTSMLYFNVFNLTLLPGTVDFKRLQHTLKYDIDEHPEMISVYLSAMDTKYISHVDLFNKRVEMINQLNGSLIGLYDKIYF